MKLVKIDEQIIKNGVEQGMSLEPMFRQVDLLLPGRHFVVLTKTISFQTPILPWCLSPKMQLLFVMVM